MEINTYNPYDPHNGVVYSLVYHDGKLHVQWHNAVEACAAVLEYASIERIDDSTLFFNYHLCEDCPVASCLCFYDIAAEYDGIEPGEYTLKFCNDPNEYHVSIADDDNLTLLYSKNPTLTGISSIPQQDSLLYYSDKNTVNINCYGDYTLEVYDFSGKCPISQKGTGYSSIMLDGFEPGAYLISIISGDRKHTLRVVR